MTLVTPLLFRDVPFRIHPPGSAGQLERCYVRIAPELLVAPAGCGKTAALRRLVETLELHDDRAVSEDTRKDWSS